MYDIKGFAPNCDTRRICNQIGCNNCIRNLNNRLTDNFKAKTYDDRGLRATMGIIDEYRGDEE